MCMSRAFLSRLVSRCAYCHQALRFSTESSYTTTSSDDSSDGSGYSSDYESSDEDIRKHEDEEFDIRQRVLSASMRFVPQYGWSTHALSSGAESEGFPQSAHGMFPKGGIELISHFYRTSNKKLSEILAEEIKKLNDEGIKQPKVRPFVKNAIETRLGMIVPYIDHWPQAMAIQTMPQNAIEALSNLAELIDEIWYYAGDKSTDFNWYTKRASLAAVYKSTEIYMLQDKSEQHKETWSFLERRLDNLTQFGKTINNIGTSQEAAKETVKGISIMAQNILGMNSRNR